MTDVITGIFASGTYQGRNGRPLVGYPAIHGTGNLQVAPTANEVNFVNISGYNGITDNGYLDIRYDDRTYYQN